MLSNAIEEIERELAALSEQTEREIYEINGYLMRTGAKTKLRLFLKPNGRYSSFSIVWRKIIYIDWKTEKPRAKDKYIKKGRRGYLVPRSRLMVHCKNGEDWERQYVWEKEQEMALVRKKVDLLSRALIALKEYAEADGKRLAAAGQGG